MKKKITEISVLRKINSELSDQSLLHKFLIETPEHDPENSPKAIISRIADRISNLMAIERITDTFDESAGLFGFKNVRNIPLMNRPNEMSKEQISRLILDLLEGKTEQLGQHFLEQRKNKLQGQYHINEYSNFITKKILAPTIFFGSLEAFMSLTVDGKVDFFTFYMVLITFLYISLREEKNINLMQTVTSRLVSVLIAFFHASDIAEIKLPDRQTLLDELTDDIPKRHPELKDFKTDPHTLDHLENFSYSLIQRLEKLAALNIPRHVYLPIIFNNLSKLNLKHPDFEFLDCLISEYLRHHKMSLDELENNIDVSLEERESLIAEISKITWQEINQVMSSKEFQSFLLKYQAVSYS